MSYRFAFQRYCLPMDPPLRTAHGPWGEREGLMLRLEDESGRVGFGEVAPIPWFGTEPLAEAEALCRKFGDRVGDDLLDQVPERFGCLRFALDAARVELVGRGLRTPPGSHEAGSGDPALQAKLRVPLTALLPAGRAGVAALATGLEAGWLTFKWKVGVGDPDEELGLLDELIERLPGYAKLRLDANGAWTRRQAAQWLERCAERPVEFVEQPLAPADEDGLLGLAGDYPVTLALDESVVRLAEARHWQEQGWPGVFVIKPALAGPLTELMEWARRTKPDVVLSSAIETALGRAAIWRALLGRAPGMMKRAPGFGVGGIFGNRLWDGPFTGPVLDADWREGVNEEAMWDALKA